MASGSRAEYRIKVEKDVPATMRDGTRLYADIYRPDAAGRFPVILLRLPYGKHMAADFGDHEYFPARGYVVVIQDARGRFTSEGEYYPLITEGEDGYDTVEWAARLPYANGVVGAQGQSYLGACQYQLAPTRPPSLACAFPVSAAADYHASWTYQGGAFQLGWQLPYAIFMVRNTMERLGIKDELWPKLRPDLLRSINFGNPLTPDAYMRLPLMEWAELLAETSPYLRDYLTHPDDGPYWWPINIKRQHRNINLPMYHVSSWYDIFLNDAIVHFNGLRANAMTPAARGAQKLLLGPWAHLFPFTTPTTGGTGDIDFGPGCLDGPARDPDPLVRLLVEGHGHRHLRRAAHQVLHHGAQPMARRQPVAAARDPIHALVFPQRRACQHPPWRWRVELRSAAGRARRPLIVTTPPTRCRPPAATP